MALSGVEHGAEIMHGCIKSDLDRMAGPIACRHAAAVQNRQNNYSAICSQLSYHQRVRIINVFASSKGLVQVHEQVAHDVPSRHARQQVLKLVAMMQVGLPSKDDVALGSMEDDTSG